jgi:tRNA pseudouridine55 synthase
MQLKSGWIFLNKPADIISRSLLNNIQRKLGAKAAGKKVGFAGTLDPFATGILPIAIGGATRLIEYLMLKSKEYIFEMQFGISTDTYDITGNVLERRITDVNQEQLEKIIPEFVGEIWQRPPAFSAVKIEGKRACDIARKTGEVFLLEPKKIKINSLELVGFDHARQTAILKMDCHSGTYVRSLVVDLAEKLGVIATTNSICRSKIGKISVNSIISLENLLKMLDNGQADEIIAPIDIVLDDILAIETEGEDSKKLMNGMKLVSKLDNLNTVSLYSDGSFFGIGEVKDGMLIPLKIFNNN